MKVLITGGLGFIGRALTRKFLAVGGHEITIVDLLKEQVHGPSPDYSEITDQDSVEHIAQDICEPGVLRNALEGVDIVYHLAAETGTGQSMYEIETYCQTNVQGTAILLQEIIRTPVRPKALILASSRSVYGEGAYVVAGAENNPGAQRYYPGARAQADMLTGRFDFIVDGQPLIPVATREDDPANPLSIYAATKLNQEQLCHIACTSMGMRFVALRLQNVYGPGQSLRNPYTGILSIFANLLRQGKLIEIFEDGAESRDFVFIEDVARAFRAAVDLPAEAPEIFNVGYGEATSVSRLVDLLEAKFGVCGRSRVSGRFRPGDIRHNWADVSRMHRFFGFTPLVPLKEGLDRTIEWALSQPVEEDRSEQANRELETLKK